MGNNIILGTGLICLDIVDVDGKVRITNGGSCANVLSILSLFKWKVYALKPKFNDKCDEFISSNLRKTSIIEMNYINTTTPTPRIIELLDNGKHNFLTNCPKCGKKILNLPLIDERNALNVDLSDIKYFYFDRISAGIRKIASIVQSNQGIVFYEPNTSRNVSLLINDCFNADIVKFSIKKVSLKIANQIRSISNEPKSRTKIIIATDGNNGLLFCHKNENNCMSDWFDIPANKVENLIDTSGAGDWLTAGFICSFFDSSTDNLKLSIFYDYERIYKSLLKGIKCSELCCKATGAQGVFYSKKLLEELNNIFSITDLNIFNKLNKESYFNIVEKSICEKCLI